MKKKLSLAAVRSAFSIVLRRFPVSFVFVTLFVIRLCVSVVVVDYSPLEEATVTALAEGALMALVVNIWCEFTRRRKYVKAGQLAVIAVSFADFVYIYLKGGLGGGNAENVGRVALYTALAVAVVYLPAVNGLSRKQLWRYTLSQIRSLAVAVLIVLVLGISVSIIFLTCNVLFGFDNSDVMEIVLYIAAIWIPVTYFLRRVPRVGEISRGRLKGAPVAAFCLYVLLPVLVVYGVILYVYLFKVVFTMKLPVNSISWMTVAMTAGALTVLYGLTYYLFADSAKPVAVRIAKVYRQSVPWVLLPLLALMSVGLVYRINEYGITVSRLYVGLFNLWSYAVMAYLIKVRTANLNRVAASFAVAFVVVSVIPGCNFTTIADASVRSRVRSTLMLAGVKSFPIDESKLKSILATLDGKDAQDLASQVAYLDDWRDHSRISDIVSSENCLSYYELTEESDSLQLCELRAIADNGYQVPAGYDSFREIMIGQETTVAKSASHVKVALEQSDSCLIPLDSIMNLSDKEFRPFVVPATDDGAFVVTKVYVKKAITDKAKVKVKIGGYLFSHVGAANPAQGI